jgi:putative SOS response-associated peptidase YedK
VCGRFVTASSPALIADRFAVDEIDATVTPDPEPDYNVSPRRNVLVVREQAAPEGEEGEEGEPRRVLSRLRWGLVPSWAKELKIGDRMINARAETVATKPSYRRAFAKKRCLIPADGFYEWQAQPGKGDGTASTKAKPRKQPYFIHRKDGEPLAFAGLWEVWKVPEDSPDDTRDVGGDDGWLRSCVIVTTTANELMAPIHDRMPVILPESAWAQWLDPEEHDVEALAKLLVPAEDGLLEAYPVSTEVNNARNNGPQLARAVVV